MSELLIEVWWQKIKSNNVIWILCEFFSFKAIDAVNPI